MTRTSRAAPGRDLPVSSRGDFGCDDGRLAQGNLFQGRRHRGDFSSGPARRTADRHGFDLNVRLFIFWKLEGRRYSTRRGRLFAEIVMELRRRDVLRKYTGSIPARTDRQPGGRGLYRGQRNSRRF